MKSAIWRLIVAGVLLAAPGVLAEDSLKGAPASDASKTAPTASLGKAAPLLIVTVDRETGRLRPATAEERAALAAAGGRRVLGRTGEATVVETRSDGSHRARLGPEYFRWSAARVNPDGTLSYDGAPAGKATPPGARPSAPSAPEK